MTRLNLRILLLLALSPSLTLHAADDDDLASTNADKRPIEELFKTDTVYPQEKGELEVELAGLYQKHNSRSDSWTVPLSLEYGLSDTWQVEAEWDAFIQNDVRNHSAVRGIGDLELGTQYSFMNIDGSLFHVAPRFSIEIPIGDVNKDLSEGFLEYEPAVIVARDVPQLHSQLFTEVGLNFVQRINSPEDADDAEPAAHEFNLGAGFFTLIPHGALTMEFNWTNNQWNHHGTENTLYVTPGFLWKVVRNVEVGVGVPVGLNGESDRYQIATHVVVEF